ncbi:LysR family transcriptional regulator [Sinobacterium caligoides]|uniref:LysR family transcriptional regulator n=1 Tax=Sinobacterium caligoides TaxID=933926 RepID=A0A3N2E157_9GAMM|nr:LysR substrate-binding domain-containing protein [Sinobacterium caligoides]ROS05379.1 LysR family transcriptional regulator [Sinobacterium caligoides]
MDLRTISYFLAVVDAEGFAKASANTFITQSALSKSVRQLEAELDAQLLERGKRGTALRLTQAGEIVYRHGKELLQGKRAMLKELTNLQQLATGELALGIAPLGVAELFAPIIADYRRQYPAIDMQLMIRGGIEQAAALDKGEIELATGIIGVDNKYQSVLIYDDEMVLVVAEQHPLSGCQQVSMAQLVNTPQILFEKEYALHDLIETACLQAGFPPCQVTRVSHVDLGIALVAAGTGVMVLPRFIATTQQRPGVVIKTLADCDLSWRLSLFWKRGHMLSPAAQAMLDMITAQYQ